MEEKVLQWKIIIGFFSRIKHFCIRATLLTYSNLFHINSYLQLNIYMVYKKTIYESLLDTYCISEPYLSFYFNVSILGLKTPYSIKGTVTLFPEFRAFSVLRNRQNFPGMNENFRLFRVLRIIFSLKWLRWLGTQKLLTTLALVSLYYFWSQPF